MSFIDLKNNIKQYKELIEVYTPLYIAIKKNEVPSPAEGLVSG
jgi:hypothetical protein